MASKGKAAKKVDAAPRNPATTEVSQSSTTANPGLSFPKLDFSSDELITTKVPPGTSHPRNHYLANSASCTRPWISHSLVPKAFVEFLMREKKDSALDKKFVSMDVMVAQSKRRKALGYCYAKDASGEFVPDRITNLEGALHTFVVPVVDAVMHGDYVYNASKTNGKHGVLKFGDLKGKQLGRRLLVSALVQQDFGDALIMVTVAALLEKNPTSGILKLPKQISVEQKQDDKLRAAYDEKIRQYLVYHLTLANSLPAASAVQDAMSISQTCTWLTNMILSPASSSPPTLSTIPEAIQNKYLHHKSTTLSLEMLFHTACHQIHNELLLLEQLCQAKGYIYTWDPPVLFTFFFGPASSSQGTELLSLVHIVALKHIVATRVHFIKAMKLFAWNDFHSKIVLSLLRAALYPLQEVRKDLMVGSKADLFARKGAKAGDGVGLYTPPKGTEGAILVVHNNSDGFGQNIETEAASSSMDGAIGAYSSASGCLLRDRDDLCDFVYETLLGS